MPFLERAGAKIYHEIYGDENAPVMLLSNAFGCSTAMWQKQIAPFSKKFRLILWDIRGHGQTQVEEKAENFSHTLALEDLSALLENYKATPAIIGGLSLGGYLSLLFYNHYPQNGKGAAFMRYRSRFQER